MQVQSVRCNHCGAPLQVQENARFVTCKYCQSELTIHRSDSAISTEVLAEISRKTDRIAEDLGVVRLQGDLDRLDREWQMKREELLVRDPSGKLHEPRRAGAMQLFLVIVVCIPLVGAFVGSGGNAVVPIIITVILVLAVLGGIAAKKSPFQTAKLAYERQRAELQAKLDQIAPRR